VRRRRLHRPERSRPGRRLRQLPARGPALAGQPARRRARSSRDLQRGGGSTLTFQGGQLVLAQDGTYTLEVEAEFNGGGVTLTDEGNYSTAGNSIDFTPTGSPERMKDGTISGNAMTAQTQFGGIPFEIDLSK
jgi:hypothetical protein